MYIKRFLSFTAIAAMIFGAVPAFAQDADATEEPTSATSFSGQIIELSSTEVPTTIIVRENPQGEFTDHTVEIDSSATLNVGMDDWMPGDYVRISGEVNGNTSVVTARRVENSSINARTMRGLNGWIEWIADDGSQIGVQWNGVVHTINITANTHLVGANGPQGTIADFAVGDRVRLRLNQSAEAENEARIIMVLRRGPHIFNLARTRSFFAELTIIDGTSNTMNVKLATNDHLRDGDVNNLIGITGEEITVTWDENTSFRRKYFGQTGPDELVPGDRLQIVGRVNDDGTVSARMIRDTDIFRKDVFAHIGEIVEVDTDANTFVIVNAREGAFDARWTINYTDETIFHVRDQETATERDLEVGMLVRLRGTANTRTHTVDALAVAIFEDPRDMIRKPARLFRILEDAREYVREM